MSREAFLNTIRNDPDDDLPRLVYADWLEEQGDEARAEFIRVQCELARLSPRHPRYAILEDREHDLLSEHEPEWLGFDPRDDYSPTEWTFRRGFLADIITDYLEPDSKWLQWHFLTDLTLGFNFDYAAFRLIAHSNWFYLLTNYTSTFTRHTDSQLNWLATSSKPLNLRELRFHQAQDVDSRNGLATFCSSAQLPNLRFLGLHCYDVSDEELSQILNSSHFSFTGLSISQSDDVPARGLSAAGIATLAESPALRRLNFLSLRNTPGIGWNIMMPLAESPFLSPLCELDISGCGASESTRAALRMRLGKRLTD